MKYFKRKTSTIVIAFCLLAILGIRSERADAQTQIKPYMLIIFDTSGSMAFDLNGNYLWGDGTNDTWGSRQCCRGDSATGSRMYQCKNAIYQVVASTGDITFGLMKFPQYFVSGHRQMDWYCDNQTAYSWCDYGPWNWTGHDYLRYDGECSSGTLTDYLVVQFAEESSNDVLMWVDNREYSAAFTPISATERELRADGPTPLAWTVQRARTYFAGTVIPGDDKRDCRPYFAVVLGDGDESCDGNPGNAVRDLYTINWGGSTYHVRTYVIGYGTSNANLNQMADYGWDGIDNNIPATAYRADSTDDVARIFSDIIADTVLIEVCNEKDDDCDCPGDTDGDTVVCDPGDDGVDEGWQLFCDLQGDPVVTDPILCDDPGETVCDGVDDNCNCTADTNGDTVWCGPGDDGVDEGLLNACGECGPIPEEICDGVDNNCDTVVDNPPVCDECTPQPEVCDGADNDCDGRVDEGLSRICGRDIPPCTLGTQDCVEDGAGVWTDCTGVTPEPEECDGVDNDCDGVVDGMSDQCEMAEGVGDTGECTYGYTICVDSVWSDCQGGIGPRDEVCDNKDNDCDGRTDEDNPGGGARCGTEEGECQEGTLECRSGSLICMDEIGLEPEECDGLDNDCDGTVDDGNPGGGEACGPVELDRIGLCRAGIITCITDGYGEAHFECVGAVYPDDEICNCLDDDCDTVADNDLPAGVECGDTDEGECEYGELACDPVGCEWVCEGEVGPEDEECDGLDNNCDGTVDEGNPGGGGGCGETEGECEPGVLWCKTSDTPPPCEPPDPIPEDEWLLCLCGKGPVDEECNGLDDDCDGDIDEGLGVGDACGETEGECEPGVYLCIDGEVVCVGGRGPQNEICDCLDNDCDIEVDEDDPCGGAAVCYHDTSSDTCYCVEPCNPSVEFPCSEPGQACMELEGHEGYYCVGDPCDEVECDEDEICRYGDCVLICDGVSCPDGQVCMVRGGVGICVEANCYVDDPELQCGEGERCRNGECEPDPCWEVDCPGGQFCREGECYDPCEGEDIIVCEDGYYCYDGECVEDLCYEADCPSGQVCDPDTGACVSDPCDDVDCMYPLICVDGECVDAPCSFVDCPEGYVCVDDTCINEETIADEEEAPPEAVPDRADTLDAAVDGDDVDGGSWDVMATGGGGCAACAVAAGTGDGPMPPWYAILVAALALLPGLNRKRAGRPFRAAAGEEEDGR